MWKFNEKCDSFVKFCGARAKNLSPGHKFLKKSSKNTIFSMKNIKKLYKNYENYVKNKRKVICGSAGDWNLDPV